jgi:glycosyltransferase involved in cell wall biosynthesis
VATAANVTRFVANSNFVRDRIQKYYQRDADVIHPFVNDAFFAPPLRQEREDFDLVVSALVPYKRLELALGTGRRTIVIGDGPMLKPLKASAGPNVTFIGSVTTEVILDHLARARALILPGVEDFGIAPVEAMALGTPVVAFRAGGALDSVVENRTGIFFDEPVVHSLVRALEAADGRRWDREAIREHAAEFSRDRFQKQLMNALRQVAA